MKTKKVLVADRAWALGLLRVLRVLRALRGQKKRPWFQSRNDGEGEVEGGSLAELGSDPKLSSVAFHDALAD